MVHLKKKHFIDFAKHIALWLSVLTLSLLCIVVLIHTSAFGPAGTRDAPSQQFVLNEDTSVQDVAKGLYENKMVKYPWAFQIAYVLTYKRVTVSSGGYVLSSGQDAWAIAKKLGEEPYLAWIRIKDGMRREQVTKLLATTFHWDEKEKELWEHALNTPEDKLHEGIFLPDSYLIPSDQSPEKIEERIRARFNEATAELQEIAKTKNIAWNDVVILASLVEKEASKTDKALVSGILWNRIRTRMMLQVDATLQYIKGTEMNGWWPVPRSEDKYLVSPFNTYKHAGLPPSPIATPTLSSIEAVLNPEKTTCLFYLHDLSHIIHCARTYAGHVENIERYLK